MFLFLKQMIIISRGNLFLINVEDDILGCVYTHTPYKNWKGKYVISRLGNMCIYIHQKGFGHYPAILLFLTPSPSSMRSIS